MSYTQLGTYSDKLQIREDDNERGNIVLLLTENFHVAVPVKLNAAAQLKIPS